MGRRYSNKLKTHDIVIRIIFGTFISCILLYIIYDKYKCQTKDFVIVSEHKKQLNDTHSVRYLKAVTNGINNLYPLSNQYVVKHYYCDSLMDDWSLSEDDWQSNDCYNGIEIYTTIYIRNNYNVIIGNIINPTLVLNDINDLSYPEFLKELGTNMEDNGMPYFVDKYIWVL